MKEEKLNEFVRENKTVYNFYNENVLHEIVNSIQENIKFAFLIERHKERELIPKLFLSEDFEDIDSNKTHQYNQPLIYISLKKRVPVSTNPRNNNNTFGHSNIISGMPKFFKQYQEDGAIYESALMNFDNQFELVLLTKNIKEQLEVLNILERALNIYSNIIKSNTIAVAGITSIIGEGKKTSDNLTKTVINFEVRTNEIVKIDKNYILKGYRIYTDEFETGSGEIKNDKEWEEYPKDGEYIDFP